MATASNLRIELLSDSTFSRGEGTAGAVDTEIEHDEFGIPYLGGKTVRGLLRDSWLSMQDFFPELGEAAGRVLGRSRAVDESCKLRIGDALLPSGIRNLVRAATEREERPLSAGGVLESFTAIRYQTAESRATGAPDTTTLRSSRVVLRSFWFESPLIWLNGYQAVSADIQILALSSLATRHGGLLRNRGRGHLRITINGDSEQTRRQAEGRS